MSAPQPVRTTVVDRVSTLELFFDLVFVFTITQLTLLLADEPSWGGLVKVASMLCPIWWMYGGYAWLTNHVPPDRPGRRLLLVAAMAAYLVLALSIPRAYVDNGVTFGLAYLAIVVIHIGLFLQADLPDPRRAVMGFAPNNLGWALVILAGGAFGGTVRWVLWIATAVLIWAVPRLRSVADGFDVSAAHFVERHGAVVIVALGESVVAVGVGAGGRPVDVDLVVVAVLGLLLNAALWWTYFGGDDERAVAALAAAPPSRRGVMSLDGFGLWHLPILLGVILVAAGLEPDVAQPSVALALGPALMLASGVTLYFVGEAGFRRALQIGSRRARLVAGVLALPTVWIGTQWTAEAQLVALVVLVGALIAIEAAAPPSQRPLREDSARSQASRASSLP